MVEHIQRLLVKLELLLLLPPEPAVVLAVAVPVVEPRTKLTEIARLYSTWTDELHILDTLVVWLGDATNYDVFVAASE